MRRKICEIMTKQTIFISGASSGFGFLTAKALTRKGHTVFATMRASNDKNARAASELIRYAENTPGKIYVLKMDVTKEYSVQAAVDKALSLEDNIDVVANNAGVGAIGLTECFTADQFCQIFDVNLFGVQRVNRAFLPAMRKRGSGLLIHISSIVGRLVPPFSCPYAASKFALETLAESYHYELAPLGIESIIVEPGSYSTNFEANKQTPSDKERMAEYGPMVDMVKEIFTPIREAAGLIAPDPEDVADSVVKLIEMPAGKRPFRTVIGAGMFDQSMGAINNVYAEVYANLEQQNRKIKER
jgi:NAD(P)-dependent dehydrogenase (short-subunit alcohol dehydrogenase family)